MMNLFRNNPFTSRLRAFMVKHMHNMISCREFEEFILDYLEDTLSPEKKKIFEFHLKLCPECREYLAAYKRTVELNKAVFSDPDAPLPDNVPEDLVKAILDANR